MLRTKDGREILWKEAGKAALALHKICDGIEYIPPEHHQEKLNTAARLMTHASDSLRLSQFEITAEVAKGLVATNSEAATWLEMIHTRYRQENG